MNATKEAASATTFISAEIAETVPTSELLNSDVAPSIVSVVPPPSRVSVGSESSSSSIASVSDSDQGKCLNSQGGSPKLQVALVEATMGVNGRISVDSCPIVERPVGNPMPTDGRLRKSFDALEGPVAKKARVEELRGTKTPPLVLSLPTDASVLPPLHVFARKQIEVFQATEADLALPAPGRKIRIRLGQVGLRCIHCSSLPYKDRVKRAVCFPSSVGRVYNSLSDMKHDHIPICKGLPTSLRQEFNALKEENKVKRYKKSKNTACASSTAQYYHDTSLQLGMRNGAGGIFMSQGSVNESTSANNLVPTTSSNQQTVVPILPDTFHQSLVESGGPQGKSEDGPVPGDFATHSVSSGSSKTSVLSRPMLKPAAPSSEQRLLASPLDTQYLNELHCFVRQHIQVFAATSKEVSAPCPGRKTRVILGQVGLRCIHCMNLPPKDRVKRAVCYPNSVDGIYHLACNMQYDHFGKCHGLPEAERQRFQELRKGCGRHGPRIAKGSKVPASGESTSKYYKDSATRMGLVDSDTGIRFGSTTRVVESQEDRCRGLTCTDGISALMIAAAVRSSRAV